MVQDLLQLSRVAETPLRTRPQPLGRSVDEALPQLRLSPPLAAAIERVRVKCSRCRSARSTPT